MRYSFLVIVSALLCFVCAAQNNDDASKYMSNPGAALADAKKALDNGEFERAKKLATIYNALSNSTRGNEIIKEADTHIESDALINKARELFVSEEYIDALKVYISALALLDKDSGAYDSIERCCQAIVAKRVNVPSDAELGNRLYELFRNSSSTAAQSLGLLQVSALSGNGYAAQRVGTQCKDTKDFANAVKYYEIAKTNGLNVAGQLGYCYSNLASSDRNRRTEYEKKAYDFFLEDAKLGDNVSQYNLGLVLKSGEGTPVDLYAARHWFEQSYKNGYEKAKEQYDKLNEQLTRKQADSLNRVQSVITNGGGKVRKLDWTDLVLGDKYIGARYSYSKNVPVSLALIGSAFEVGQYRIEGGYINSPVVFSHETIIKDSEGEITESEKSMYMPSFYLTVAPGLFFKYFALDIGIGAMISPRKYYAQSIGGTSTATTISVGGATSTTSISSGGTTISIGDESFSKGKEIVSTTSNYGWIHFILQPTIALMLPIADESFILTAHAGYNYIPDCPQISNWSFGIGFLVNLDY